uniref:DUF3071 domain-containing protein n=1 Tax=Globodera pallida TaxID=36090 RepID=A0A183CJL2_GLOPA
MYEVRFQDGKSGRFHANQLWDRKTDDKEEDPLDVFNDAFGLALIPAEDQNRGDLADPPVEEVVPMAPPAPPVEPTNAAVVPAAPIIEQPGRPQRNRRPPKRFSPGH